MGITTVSNSQSYCEEDLWCYLSLPLPFLPPPHPHHPQSSSKSFSWSLLVRGLFSCRQNYVWKFPIVYCLQECPQISIHPISMPLTVWFLSSSHLFSYLSNLGWFCDLLWSTEYRSIIMPVQVVLNPSVCSLGNLASALRISPDQHVGWWQPCGPGVLTPPTDGTPCLISLQPPARWPHMLEASQ